MTTHIICLTDPSPGHPRCCCPEPHQGDGLRVSFESATRKREREAAAATAILTCPVCRHQLVHLGDAGALYESRRCSACGCLVRLPRVALMRALTVSPHES